jgi:hypothetical protein
MIVLLDSSVFLAQRFWSWFCKLALFNTVISGQNFLVHSSAGNQTGQGQFRHFVRQKKSVIWIGTITTFISWKYATTIHHIYKTYKEAPH